LVAGDRVQPGPEPVRLPQLADPLAGDHERVMHRVRGRVLVPEHPAAVRVEPVTVLPIGTRQAARVASGQRQDEGVVIHGEHRSTSTSGRSRRWPKTNDFRRGSPTFRTDRRTLTRYRATAAAPAG